MNHLRPHAPPTPSRRFARSRQVARRSGILRLGLVRIAAQSRHVLGDDLRKLPILVVVFFVMGLLEAGVILLIVQMAVTLASDRTTFDLVLGPVTIENISMRASVITGVVLILTLVALILPTARMSGTLIAKAQLRTRSRLIRSYLRANWTVRSSYQEGHLQELLTIFSVRAEHATTQLIQASIALCGLTAILLTALVAAPLVAIVAIMSVSVAGILLRPIMTRTRAAAAAQTRASRDFASHMAELARITPEIAAFDVTEPVESIVIERASDVSTLLRRLRIMGRIVGQIYQYTAMLLVILAIGVFTIIADADVLATMGAVMLLLIRALNYGQVLQSQIQASNETAPYLERIERELRTLTAAEADRSGSLIDRPTPLKLDDVWFAYQAGDPVLRGVSFDVASGESIGVIGPSGSGKSTLIQILLRLREPDQGQVLVDEIPLDQVALSRWYELVAYVPQDNQLIRATVADNIRFFRSGFSEGEVIEAAVRAHLHDEIKDLPQGYDTPLGQGVRQLSGGQRQRLGIARALLGDPQLIILDEPTSALDSRSEALIADTLADLHGSVTTIIVAHRPATTAICDRLVRMQDGRVAVEDHTRRRSVERTSG